MPGKFFISYARRDDDRFVEKLYWDLKNEGFDVWYDIKSMPNRALTFLDEIQKAITDADRLLLIATPRALNESEYVRAEWEYALKICKHVFTVLRQSDYSDLPSRLRKDDVRDFRDDSKYNKEFKTMLRQLTDDVAPLGDLYRVSLPSVEFIERTKDVAELSSQVCVDLQNPVVINQMQQVTVIYGIPGIGKTALAAEFATDCAVRRAFPDGIFWLKIEQTANNSHITSQMENVGINLGDDAALYTEFELARTRLSKWLATRKVLLILDDVWDQKHIDAFTIIGARSRILVTTRLPALADEYSAYKIRELTEDEALKIITNRIELDPAQPNQYENEYREIIKLLNRHPLAISIVATRLKSKGLPFARDLLKQLQKGRIFDNLRIPAMYKNHDLEKVLRPSYDDLKDDEQFDDLQRRFRELSVFAPNSSFDLEAVHAVWQGDHDHSDRALDALAAYGLITRDNTGTYTYGRCQQHSLLRTYAQFLLEQAVDKNALERLHYAHFQHYEKLYGTPSIAFRSEHYQQLLLDLENLQQALAWGFKHEPEHLERETEHPPIIPPFAGRSKDLTHDLRIRTLRIVIVVYEYLENVPQPKVFRKDFLLKAEEVARQYDVDVARVYILRFLARTGLKARDGEDVPAEYKNYAQQAFTIAEGLDDPRLKIEARLTLSLFAQDENNWAEGKRLMQQAYTLWEQSDDRDPLLELRIKKNLAVFTELDHYQQDAIRLADQLERPDHLAELYYNRAEGRMEAEDFEGALSDFNKALEAALKVNNQSVEIRALTQIAEIYREQKRFGEAQREFEASHQKWIDYKLYDPDAVSLNLINGGLFFQEIKHYAEADKWFEEGIEFNRKALAYDWKTLIYAFQALLRLEQAGNKVSELHLKSLGGVFSSIAEGLEAKRTLASIFGDYKEHIITAIEAALAALPPSDNQHEDEIVILLKQGEEALRADQLVIGFQQIGEGLNAVAGVLGKQPEKLDLYLDAVRSALKTALEVCNPA